MYHTSPKKIESGMINDIGIAGSCLFFSGHVYVMCGGDYYVYEADFNCIEARELHDDKIIDQISLMFDVDLDTAEDLLCSRESEFNYGNDADKSWWLQGKRGECAVKMGFDGCEDEDEQGTVYIVPMLGRESELNLVDFVQMADNRKNRAKL